MGSGLPAPVAVVVLSEAAKYTQKEDIKTSLQTTLDKVNARLESHERMANLVIVDDEWTIENDLLTPTLKLKRNKLEDKYSQLISQLFSEPIVWENEPTSNRGPEGCRSIPADNS